MNKQALYRLMAGIWFVAVTGDGCTRAAAPRVDEPPSITPSNEPVKLFDGKTLGDCHTWLQDAKLEDPRSVFRVADGLLHISGDGLGSIITNKSYRDYHLVLEYRWGDKTWGDRENAARDSGLLIHSHGPDGGYQGIWMSSIEVQIIEGGVGDFILVSGNDVAGQPLPMSLTAQVARDRDGEVVWQEGAPAETFDNDNRQRINWRQRDADWKDVKGFRGAKDVESPGQQWTRIDVLADGKRITTYVNGVKVNEAVAASPAEGRLQLQTELAEIYFRRWELYPIGKGPTPAPAQQ